jgi:hypothetical protein
MTTMNRALYARIVVSVNRLTQSWAAAVRLPSAYATVRAL